MIAILAREEGIRDHPATFNHLPGGLHPNLLSGSTRGASSQPSPCRAEILLQVTSCDLNLLHPESQTVGVQYA